MLKYCSIEIILYYVANVIYITGKRWIYFALYDGVTYYRTLVWASCLQTLTARINLSNTPFERETLSHQYSKATIRKTNAYRQYWHVNTPLSKCQHFRVLKIVTQFRTVQNALKLTETARTDCEDARWSLEIGNSSSGALGSNLLTGWRWVRATISQRVNFGNVASPKI